MKRPPLQVPYAVVVGSMMGKYRLPLPSPATPNGQPQAAEITGQSSYFTCSAPGGSLMILLIVPSICLSWRTEITPIGVG